MDNELAEVYANIRNKALEEAALAVVPPMVNELGMVSIEWAQRHIRALKNYGHKPA